MAKINLKESGKLAGIVLAAVYIVNWVFGNVLNMIVQPLFSAVQPVSIVTGTPGGKVISFVSGLIPLPELLTASTIIMTYISALAVVIIGTYIIGLNVPVFKSFLGFDGNAGRIASILLWGAVPVYILLIGTAIPNLMTVVGILLHTILVAFVAVFVAGLLKIRI